MNVGVFGDSFADINQKTLIKKNVVSTDARDESWVTCLKDFGHEVTSFGLSATSTYYAYQNFIENYQLFDCVIFCYSSLGRIHHIPKFFGLTYGFHSCRDVDTLHKNPVFKKLPKEMQEDLEVIVRANMLTNDFEYDTLVQQAVFDKVNKLCTDRKIINILTFLENKTPHFDISQNSGDCLYDLYEVSRREKEGYENLGDDRCCHLTKENNVILARIIDSLITQPRQIKEVIDLKTHPSFVYSKENTQRYIL